MSLFDEGKVTEYNLNLSSGALVYKVAGENGEKTFSVFNTIFLVILAAATLFPFIYVLAASFSSPEFINRGSVWLWPVGFTTDAYTKVFEKNGRPAVKISITKGLPQRQTFICGVRPLLASWVV